MLNHTYQVTDKVDFSASSTKSIDIPETGYINEMNLLLELYVTPATSVSANEDALARIIDALKITAAGGKSYFTVDDGRQLLYHCFHQYQGQLLHDPLPSAGGSATTVRALFPLHFGLDPFDSFDPSVIIPAAELSNLKLEVTWGSASDLGTGYTITPSSSQMRVVVKELTLEKGETRDKIWPDGINVPLFESRSLSLSATASNLGKTDDVPVGSMLHSALIIVLNSSGNRSDTDVTEFGTKYPKLALEEFRIDNFYAIKGINRKQFLLPGTVVGQPSSWLSDPKGVFLFKFSEVTGKAIGIDLSTAMTGDVKLGFTVASTGGQILILYRSIALG